MAQRERNPYVSPGLRLLGLYVLLRSGKRKYSLTRLAKLFRCSRQTILRMMEQLGLVGDIELESWTEGRERYYQFAQQSPTDHISLSVESLQQLMLCRDIVRHLLPKPLHEEIRNTIGAATILLPDKKEAAQALDSFASARGRGTIDYTPFQGSLETLQAGMRESRLCKVKYRPQMTGPAKVLVIAPVRLMAYREALYVRCYSYDEQGRKAFDKILNLAVHRMASVQLMKRTFAYPNEPEEANAFGLEFSNPFKARVAFSSSVATYVAERVWSKDQRIRRGKDGGIVLTFTTTSRPEVVSWILGFGPQARVLEPTDLAAEIQQALRKTLTGYRKTLEKDQS